MRRKLTNLGCYVSVYTYAPGTRFTPHRHAADKIDGLLSGRFLVRMAGREIVLEPGDLLWVPRETVHSAEVVGRDPVVSLDGVRRNCRMES